MLLLMRSSRWSAWPTIVPCGTSRVWRTWRREQDGSRLRTESAALMRGYQRHGMPRSVSNLFDAAERVTSPSRVPFLGGDSSRAPSVPCVRDFQRSHQRTAHRPLCWPCDRWPRVPRVCPASSLCMRCCLASFCCARSAWSRGCRRAARELASVASPQSSSPAPRWNTHEERTDRTAGGQTATTRGEAHLRQAAAENERSS
jgi:hypothetical protein